MSQISWLITVALLAMVCFSILEAAPMSDAEIDARTTGLLTSIGNVFQSIVDFKHEVVKVVLSPITYIVGIVSGN